jgi:hypothetical protein
MRVLPVVLASLALAACGGEAVRHTYKVSLEGQSPPEPPPPPPSDVPKEAPIANSAGSVSPAWLRANAPFEWTAPPGWTLEPSTKPNRLFECTLDPNGPGKAPVQFIILYGGDDQPDPMKLKNANFTRWQMSFQDDQAPQSTNPDHDGIKILRTRVHGEFKGQPSLGNSEMIDEANWTMIYGYFEGPNGSLMFRMQGPDAVIKPNEAKLDQFLASLKSRTPKTQ